MNTTVKKATVRPYKIAYKIGWATMIDSAKGIWPSVSNTEPTEDDLKSLAYKIALTSTDKGFNLVAEILRPFQDSDIQCEFVELIPDLEKPTDALYNITIRLAADTPSDKPDMTAELHDRLQRELNIEFVDNIATMEVQLKELGLTW